MSDLLRRRHAHAVESLTRGLSFRLSDDSSASLRLAFSSSDESFRESILEQLKSTLSPAIAEKLITAYRETVIAETSLPTLSDMLAARLRSVDPYVRAIALFALGESGASIQRILEITMDDEHELVRETARYLKARAAGASGPHAQLMTVEKMIALRRAPIFANLAPEGLAELARASREAEIAAGAELCAEGEPGEEVYIVLSGDVEIFSGDGGDERIVTEKAGAFISELAALDSGPRSARVRAGQTGARVLRLDGEAFREAVGAEPSIASQVIRTLAQQLRNRLVE